jgi:hypothetical protein
MNKVNDANKEVGNPEKHHGVVLADASGIPDKEENAPGHSNGEKFGNAMEQKKIVLTNTKKGTQSKKRDSNIKPVGRRLARSPEG